MMLLLCLLLTRAPPQNGSGWIAHPSLCKRPTCNEESGSQCTPLLTCHGHSLQPASSPPTILTRSKQASTSRLTPQRTWISPVLNTVSFYVIQHKGFRNLWVWGWRSNRTRSVRLHLSSRGNSFCLFCFWGLGYIYVIGFLSLDNARK